MSRTVREVRVGTGGGDYITVHPDYYINVGSIYWNTGNGYKNTICLYVGKIGGNSYYIGNGTPDEAAASTGEYAKYIIGRSVGVVHDKYYSQESNIGIVAEGREHTEYDREVSVNHRGFGTITIPDSNLKNVDSCEYKITTINASRKPGNITRDYLIYGYIDKKKNSKFYGAFVGNTLVEPSGVKITIADKKDVTGIVAVFGLEFTIKFEANGGAGTMEDVASVYGVGTYVPQDKLPVCSFTKPNMAFAGWNTEADGTGISVQDRSEIDNGFKDIVTIGGQSVTLYAQWREPNIVITKANIDANGMSAESVGTLRLFCSDDGYNIPVATENNNHDLRFEGVNGRKYRLLCQMGGIETSDFKWNALGIRIDNTYSADYEIDFTDSSSIQSLVYYFSAKPVHAFDVVSDHGTVAVTPDADTEDGKFTIGRIISLTIAPDAGWKAVRVSFVNVDTNDVYNMDIVDNVAILEGITFNTRATIDYSKIDYSISASVHKDSAHAISSVSVSIDGEIADTAHYGDTVTFSATVNDGFAFAGWYNADDELVSSEISYEASIVDSLALVAKAKVSVTLNIAYSGEGAQNCSITVGGEAYALGTPFDIILGIPFDYALVLGNRIDDTPWQFDCWKRGSEVLDLQQSGTVTPMSALEMTAHVAVSVSRKLNVYFVDSSTSHYYGKDDVPEGSVTCTGIHTQGSGGSTLLGGVSPYGTPYEFVFDRTQNVRVSVTPQITFSGSESPLTYNCLSFNEPTQEDPIPSGSAIISSEVSAVILLNAPEITIFAYYGEPRKVVTTLAYAKLSDATMGVIAVVGTDPEDTDATIGENGMTATATQGKNITLRAVPMNGYRFAGWFLSDSAIGDPWQSNPDISMVVTAERTIYARFVQNAQSVCEWEGSETTKALVWRSKTYESSKPFNPSACRVDALGYNNDRKNTLLELSVEMFSAPDSKPTATTRLTNIANQNARRLPVRRLERYMQIEVKANTEVDAVIVGTSMGGLA